MLSHLVLDKAFGPHKVQSLVSIGFLVKGFDLILRVPSVLLIDLFFL
jgi:hypothetical protein